jgi:hypothetical protein
VLAGLRAEDVVTASLPLFHVGGTIFCGLSCFMTGVELVVMSPGGMRNPAMVSGFGESSNARHAAGGAGRWVRCSGFGDTDIRCSARVSGRRFAARPSVSVFAK